MTTSNAHLQSPILPCACDLPSLPPPRSDNLLTAGKIHELRLELTSEKKDPKYARKTAAMKKVVANMTMGSDMSPLYQEVLACMKISNLEIKKMVYLFLINYSRSKPEIATLAVPYLDD
ncbi:hypothetical protein EV182_000940, partial [Spiromyces aspiralis]